MDDHETDELPVATSSSALNTCYCPAPYTCGHSSSPSYMYPAAHAAMLRAGVTDASLIQTFGDAAASVGTHCPEPGVTYSAATDIDEGGSPCTRVHNLRMQGFAAWFRVPPTFGYHIHAVYAGTPSLKTSLKNQLASFAQGRNGLASNAVETVCPITSAEKDAVARVHSGGGTTCVPGGDYCGGDKVTGAANTLYRCNADGRTATQVKVCAYGCNVNSGKDDACRICSPGGSYCGGDKVPGDPKTLYKCNADGAGATVIRVCTAGCSVNTSTDDACKPTGGTGGGSAGTGGGSAGTGGGSAGTGGGSAGTGGGSANTGGGSGGGGGNTGTGGGSAGGDTGSAGGGDPGSAGGGDTGSAGGGDTGSAGGGDTAGADQLRGGCTAAPTLPMALLSLGLSRLLRRRSPRGTPGR